MVDIASYLPSGSLVLTILFWFSIVLLICMVLGVGSYFLIDFLRYRRKIVVFGLVGGKPRIVKRDKARLVNIGTGGEKVWYMKKGKRQIPPGVIQMEKNVFWFWEKDDGDLINIGLEDLNAKFRQLQVHFTHPDMRYARLAIQRNFKDRFQKVTFWDKYGTVLIYTIHIVIVSIMFIWILDGVQKIIPPLKEAIELASKLLQQAQATSSGAALVPAT